MVTIEQVETNIAAIQKDLDTSAPLIADTEKRLATATSRFQQISNDYAALKSQRQTALANGKDVKALTSQLNGLTEEYGLLEDEVAGLTARLENLKSGAESLKDNLAVQKIKIPQIQSVELARQYNELAAKLAKVVIQLNDVLEAQPKEHHAVFFKEDWPDKVGAMRRIEKLLFSDDALTLDEHTQKGLRTPRNEAHSHLVEEQLKVLFYDRDLMHAEKLQAIQANREPVNPFAKS